MPLSGFELPPERDPPLPELPDPLMPPDSPEPLCDDPCDPLCLSLFRSFAISPPALSGALILSMTSRGAMPPLSFAIGQHSSHRPCGHRSIVSTRGIFSNVFFLPARLVLNPIHPAWGLRNAQVKERHTLTRVKCQTIWNSNSARAVSFAIILSSSRATSDGTLCGSDRSS